MSLLANPQVLPPYFGHATALIKNGVPYCIISMSRSHWSSTFKPSRKWNPDRGIRGRRHGVLSGRTLEYSRASLGSLCSMGEGRGLCQFRMKARRRNQMS